MTDALINGDASLKKEVAFYAQVAQLEHDVFTGVHPHFKLPQTAIDNFLYQYRNGEIREAPFSSFDGTPNSEAHGSLPSSLPPKPPASVSFQVPPLSKRHNKPESEQRAELALKRQKIEKKVDAAVKTAKAQRRTDDTSSWDGPRVFDVSKILSSVQIQDNHHSEVPQINATNDDNASKQSFDENQYYSSQGNSWSPEQEITNERSSAPIQAAEPTTRTATVSTSGPVVSALRAPTVSTLDTRTQRNNVSNQASVPTPPQLPGYVPHPMVSTERPHPPQSSLQTVPGLLTSLNPLPTQDFQRPQDLQTQVNPQAQLQAPSRPSIQLNLPQRESESYSPPSPAVPLVRNQIPAAVAPQASRVSSLAHPSTSSVTKQATTSQDTSAKKKQNGNEKKGLKSTNQKQRNKNEKTTNVEKTKAHESVPVNSDKSAKRGRPLEERSTPPGHSWKRVARYNSPDPQIKSEPVSPPPLAANTQTTQSAPRRLVVNADGRPVIEELTVQRKAPMQANPPMQRQRPVQKDILVEAPIASRTRSSYHPPNDRRQPIVIEDDNENTNVPFYTNEVARPLAVARRRPIQDPNNIRRIASTQIESRAYSPEVTEYPNSYVTDNGRYIRGSSRVVSDQMGIRPNPVREEYISRPVSVLEPREPVQVLRFYSPPRTTTAMSMAPPPTKKRIIIDENGEEWIAVPAPRASRQPPTRDFSYYEAPTMAEYPYAERRVPRELLYREPSFTEEPIYSTASRRHYDQYEQQRPIFRAPSQVAERRPQSSMHHHPQQRQPPQVFEIHDEDDIRSVHHHGMPPPPTRYQRHPEQVFERGLSLSEQQMPQIRPRAASIQPFHMQSSNLNPPQPGQVPFTPVEQFNSMQERSNTARPVPSQQTQWYGANAEYDPRFPKLPTWEYR